MVDVNVTPVLGLKKCKELELICHDEKIHIQEQEVHVSDKTKDNYEDVFQGLWCLKEEHHIGIKDQAQPIIHEPHRVPEVLRRKIKDGLKRIDKLHVNERVLEPSKWVSSIITVMQPGKEEGFNPKDLNEAIKCEPYPMKIIEQFVTSIPNAKVLSTLIANSGYWQIPLDNQSPKLLVYS